MNSDDVNDRKQKLNDIIKRITESQLLKIREANTNACNPQDCNFGIASQDRDNDINKPMTIQELSHFDTPVGNFNPAVMESSSEIPPPKPVSPGVTM